MVLFEKPQKPEKRMKVMFIRLIPLMLATGSFKLLIWFFEVRYGFQNPDVGVILTVLGIVIGIILATQLPFAVMKYKEANDNLNHTRALLLTMYNFMIRRKVDKKERNGFVKAAREWLEIYRGFLKDRNTKTELIREFRKFSMYFTIFDDKKIFSPNDGAVAEN